MSEDCNEAIVSRISACLRKIGRRCVLDDTKSSRAKVAVHILELMGFSQLADSENECVAGVSLSVISQKMRGQSNKDRRL